MWKAFAELRTAGWVTDDPPRMFTVQATGCAPIVRAFEAGADHADPWKDPTTIASGLRVPGPLGDRLILRALRESNGAAVAVSDEDLAQWAANGAAEEGIDFSPEGGAGVAGLRLLVDRGLVRPEEQIVVFNTGAGWLYRPSPDLPLPSTGSDIPV